MTYGFFTFKRHAAQQGFTLVELAIVLMIIGLLIGGILRGQEVIINARVASTVRTLHGFQAATTTFRDQYGGYPGDILSPNTRIPGCNVSVACVPTTTTGLNNNAIGSTVTAGYNSSYTAASALDSENRRFWSQLAAAHLISGVDPTSTASTAAWGVQYPSSNLGGGFHAAYAYFADGLITGGNYFILRNTPSATILAESSAQALLSPNVASRIDAKMDDGLPGMGDVISVSTTTATSAPWGHAGCSYYRQLTASTVSATASTYTTSDTSPYCVLMIRM